MAVFVGHAGAGGGGGGAVTRSWVGNGSTTLSLSADFNAAMIIIQGSGFITIWSYGTTTAITFSTVPLGTISNLNVSSADGRNFTFSGQIPFIQNPNQTYYATIFPLA